MKNSNNSFGTQSKIRVQNNSYTYYNLNQLEKQGVSHIHRLPYSIKILLESLLRNENGVEVTTDHIAQLAKWKSKDIPKIEIPFKPGRVILQDFTGVPAVVDLAALRSAIVQLGGKSEAIDPQVQVDLVIDHSVQVNRFGAKSALAYNVEREFKQNKERYEFLKWAANTFNNFRAVPPSTGIVHQVNLEYLATVVRKQKTDSGEFILFPDTLVGTDSHTPMVNGLGVVGWGVGGIEAEAAMLGQPIYMLMPEVVGFKLTGELREGVTATDLVLKVTQVLRQKGVVGKFVEFFGPALHTLTLPDRATLANMAPEYGATIGISPVDDETLNYLRLTGRSEELVQLVEYYYRDQGLFHSPDAPEPVFTDTVELDLDDVEPAVAGPNRPQDRIALPAIKKSWNIVVTASKEMRGFGLTEDLKQKRFPVVSQNQSFDLKHGSVVIAAITSCTNTSNPAVMMAAGLLAKKAIEAGLKTKPWVKTSLAPGSKVVTKYLEAAGLTSFLEGLGFHLVGYGCTTCIGNSGDLPEHIAKTVRENKLVVASVLSGNRNFEGRINPDVQASYLMSPPLVIAFAIAGTIDIDIVNDVLGYDPNGEPVYLKDIWPSRSEIQNTIKKYLSSSMFHEQYQDIFDGNETWNNISISSNPVYEWDNKSTYIQEPPFFKDISPDVPVLNDIRGAKVLAWMPDSTTTDHISPAGFIAPDSPAGKYLIEKGVKQAEFNSYGSRRGNHEVMMRGTLANIRIKNKLIPGIEGGFSIFQPTGEKMAMWDVAEKYMKTGTPLIILAGKEYGSGSSRDWAAKGVNLLGVKAVIAESYERIHRSNLVGMGILPLQFKAGQSVEKLGLTGFETYDIINLTEDLKAGAEITVQAKTEQGKIIEFIADCRVDTPVEIEYYKNGGILHTVLRNIAKTKAANRNQGIDSLI